MEGSAYNSSIVGRWRRGGGLSAGQTQNEAEEKRRYRSLFLIALFSLLLFSSCLRLVVVGDRESLPLPAPPPPFSFSNNPFSPPSLPPPPNQANQSKSNLCSKRRKSEIPLPPTHPPLSSSFRPPFLLLLLSLLLKKGRKWRTKERRSRWPTKKRETLKFSFLFPFPLSSLHLT